MAVGDVTQLELLAKSLTATATESQFTNVIGSVTTITSITLSLQSGAATKRTATVYKNGTAKVNEVITVVLEPTGTKFFRLENLDLVLTGTQTISVKVDAGTDVNCFLYGISEVIA